MKTLIAGFGNVLLQDDGFGVAVIRDLEKRRLPEGAETLDVGIGGFGFVLTVLDGFDRIVIVDTVRHGKPPGTLHLFRPGDEDLRRQVGGANPHLFEPATAMSMARRLGSLPGDVIVVGCEPSMCDFGIGLSSPVRNAVAPAVATVLRCIDPSSASATSQVLSSRALTAHRDVAGPISPPAPPAARPSR